MSPFYNQRKRANSLTKEECEAMLEELEQEIEGLEDAGCGPCMRQLWRRQALQDKIKGFEKFQDMKDMLVQKVTATK